LAKKKEKEKEKEYSQNIPERSGAGTRPDPKQCQNQQKHVESFFSGLSDESRRDSFEARAILHFLSLALDRSFLFVDVKFGLPGIVVCSCFHTV
ncbi:unnamed protein product, partial [Brassica rapa subsp. trilocularis]